MVPNVTADSRFCNDPNEGDPVELNRDQVEKDLKKVENKLKMEKIDKKIAKEIQFNHQYA